MKSSSKFDFIIVGGGLSGLHLSFCFLNDKYFDDYWTSTIQVYRGLDISVTLCVQIQNVQLHSRIISLYPIKINNNTMKIQCKICVKNAYGPYTYFIDDLPSAFL